MRNNSQYSDACYISVLNIKALKNSHKPTKTIPIIFTQKASESNKDY